MSSLRMIIAPYILEYWKCLHCNQEPVSQRLKRLLPVRIVEHENRKEYFLGGKLHREDGPASIRNNVRGYNNT
jgi:hypothetical protein